METKKAALSTDEFIAKVDTICDDLLKKIKDIQDQCSEELRKIQIKKQNDQK